MRTGVMTPVLEKYCRCWRGKRACWCDGVTMACSESIEWYPHLLSDLSLLRYPVRPLFQGLPGPFPHRGSVQAQSWALHPFFPGLSRLQRLSLWQRWQNRATFFEQHPTVSVDRNQTLPFSWLCFARFLFCFCLTLLSGN